MIIRISTCIYTIGSYYWLYNFLTKKKPHKLQTHMCLIAEVEIKKGEGLLRVIQGFRHG